MKTLPLLLFVFAVTRCASAEQPSPPPKASLPELPPGALLKPVVDNTRWIITSTTNTAEAAKPDTAEPAKSAKKSRSRKGTDRPKVPKSGPNPKTTTITGEKMGILAHVLIVAANGTRKEQWTDGNLTATVNGKAAEPDFSTNPPQEMPVPSWVSHKNYVESKTEGSRGCFIFHDRIIPANVEVLHDQENPGQTDPEKLKVEATAVIDAETLLPVSVTEATMVTSYKFEPLEPGTEIIPAEIRTALAERAKNVQDSMRAPARP